jgi:hypothetical protein
MKSFEVVAKSVQAITTEITDYTKRSFEYSTKTLEKLFGAKWQCPVCSPMSPLMQISEVSVKVCFVGRPRQSVHAGGGIAFEREERRP